MAFKFASSETLLTMDYLLHWFSYLAMSMSFYFLLPTLPVYVVSGLGEGEDKVGFIIGVYSLSALLIRPVAGYALDHYGRRIIYLVALIAFTLMMGFYLFASSLVLLLILRFFHGLTWGVITTGGSTIAADLVPDSRRGEGIGYFGLSITLSIALGPLLGLSIMEPDHFDALFLSAFFLSILAFVLFFFIKMPVLKPLIKRKLAWDTFIEPKVLPVAWVMMVAAVSYGGIISFVALFYQEKEIAYGSLFFLVYSIGVAVFRPFAGRIMDSRGPEVLVVPAFVANIIGLVMLAYSETMPLFLFAAFIIGLGNGVIMPTIQTMVINLVQVERRGVANSTFFSAIDLGIGGGSMILGIVAAQFDLSTMFLLCAGLLILPLVFFKWRVMRHYTEHNLNPHSPS